MSEGFVDVAGLRWRNRQTVVDALRRIWIIGLWLIITCTNSRARRHLIGAGFRNLGRMNKLYHQKLFTELSVPKQFYLPLYLVYRVLVVSCEISCYAQQSRDSFGKLGAKFIQNKPFKILPVIH